MGVYVKQYNNGRYACGPITILNALKFQGRNYDRRHLPKIARLLRVSNDGATNADIDRAIKELKLGRRMRFPSFEGIENQQRQYEKFWRLTKQLYIGNAVVVTVRFYSKARKKWSGHVMLFCGVQIHGNDLRFFIVNGPTADKPHSWWTLKELDAYYQKHRGNHWYFPMWIIPKSKHSGGQLKESK